VYRLPPLPGGFTDAVWRGSARASRVSRDKGAQCQRRHRHRKSCRAVPPAPSAGASRPASPRSVPWLWGPRTLGPFAGFSTDGARCSSPWWVPGSIELGHLHDAPGQFSGGSAMASPPSPPFPLDAAAAGSGGPRLRPAPSDRDEETRGAVLSLPQPALRHVASGTRACPHPAAHPLHARLFLLFSSAMTAREPPRTSAHVQRDPVVYPPGDPSDPSSASGGHGAGGGMRPRGPASTEPPPVRLQAWTGALSSPGQRVAPPKC